MDWLWWVTRLNPRLLAILPTGLQFSTVGTWRGPIPDMLEFVESNVTY